MVGDRVWLDVDGDGVQDVGEVGLSNVTVRSSAIPNGVPGSGDEVLVGTAFTDGNGNYLFDRVYPGTGTFYAQVLSTTLPPGLLASPGNNNGRGPSLTITGNDIYLANDFGYTAPAGTAVVGDRNLERCRRGRGPGSGEVGIGGVTLRLMVPRPGRSLRNGRRRGHGLHHHRRRRNLPVRRCRSRDLSRRRDRHRRVLTGYVLDARAGAEQSDPSRRGRRGRLARLRLPEPEPFLDRERGLGRRGRRRHPGCGRSGHRRRHRGPSQLGRIPRRDRGDRRQRELPILRAR